MALKNVHSPTNNLVTVSGEHIVYMHKLASGTLRYKGDTTKFQKRMVDWD